MGEVSVCGSLCSGKSYGRSLVADFWDGKKDLSFLVGWFFWEGLIHYDTRWGLHHYCGVSIDQGNW